MWFKRDLSKNWSRPTLPVRFLRGVRQCGKSSFLLHHALKEALWVSLDDLQNREMARRDPALLLGDSMNSPSCTVLDEVQYAPELFPEIKARVDQFRLKRSRGDPKSYEPTYWLCGSNQIQMDRGNRESLAGRASIFTLHTLGFSELLQTGALHKPEAIFLRGGWPELYVNPKLSSTQFLNDYLRTFVEKDLIASAGIEKVAAFERSLGLLAARTGQMANFSEVAGQCGVESTTLQDWFGILERNLLTFRLPAYHNNLSKRLIKTPKLYFLDVGLAARLQGWNDWEPLSKSPLIGHLFETLVLGELVRARDHLGLDIKLWYARTKEGAEIDFLVEGPNQQWLAFEAKFASSGAEAAEPKAIAQALPLVKRVEVVTWGGQRRALSSNSEQIPLKMLTEFLCQKFE